MTSLLTAGVSLKPQHFDEALACRAPGMWFEIHPENYMVAGGPRLAWLEAIRTVHPVSMHGVSLSLAGYEAPDPERLRRLTEFVRRFSPALVSEHLAWSGYGGAYLPDLLPFERSTEALRSLCRNVDQVQAALGRAIAIENPAHYLHLPGHEWSETEFLSELVRSTGCGLLLDVNNVAVSAHNLGYAPEEYLDRFPLYAVTEIHLAGYSVDPRLGDGLWIDSHDGAVSEAVWALYRRVIERSGARPTLIERDAAIPEFATLLLERQRAQDFLLTHAAAMKAAA